jgi:hypothetical protein
VPAAPLSTAERTELDGHLAAIDQNGLGHVRIVAPHLHPAVFNAGATVIDALALAWTGGKPRGPGAWDMFVREFVGDTHVGLYEHLRNPGLHNLSASAHIVLVSGARDRRHHRQEQAGMLYLHTEESPRTSNTASTSSANGCAKTVCP